MKKIWIVIAALAVLLFCLSACQDEGVKQKENGTEQGSSDSVAVSESETLSRVTETETESETETETESESQENGTQGGFGGSIELPEIPLH